MSKDNDKIIRVVSVNKQTVKSSTASVAGLKELSPQAVDGSKPINKPKKIRVTIKDITKKVK